MRTATDKQGRSVPAPGQGILVTAGQAHATNAPDVPVSPMLSLDYRRAQLELEMTSIDAWRDAAKKGTRSISLVETKKRILIFFCFSCFSYLDPQCDEEHVEAQWRRKRAAAFECWGNYFYRGDSRIAPLLGALSVWGLTIDDIEVASFHGTGTKANDFNESEVLQRQLEHLGRTRGNALMAIFQKHLTGHPKGAAAAWMLNGVLQV